MASFDSRGEGEMLVEEVKSGDVIFQQEGDRESDVELEGGRW